jgi:SAM-dependent methyltransferase
MCRSPRIARYDHDHHGRVIFRCRACGVKFLNPQYSDQYLADFYARYTGTKPPKDPRITARRIALKTDCLGWISRHVGPGRFLSIGCGDGLELEVARDHGWQVEGYEVDLELSKRTAGRTGLTVHCGDFFALRLPPDHYDCVFMDQVLEHPKNPRDYLLEAHRILTGGGVLYIGSPNIMSLANHAKTILGKLRLKRRRGTQYATFHHVFYYSPSMLAGILQRHFGFDVVALQGDPFPVVERGFNPVTWIRRARVLLNRRFPVLESTFRLVARKRDGAHSQTSPRRAA